VPPRTVPPSPWLAQWQDQACNRRGETLGGQLHNPVNDVGPPLDHLHEALPRVIQAALVVVSLSSAPF
jgi:hypothetical protein